MIIIIYLVSIEDKVKGQKAGPATFTRQKRVVDNETGKVKYVDFSPESRAAYEKTTTAKDEYERVVGKSTKPLENALAEEGKRSLGARFKSAVNNVKGIAHNATDMVIGRPMAKYYNWQTKRSLKKDPSANNQILYSLHGVEQGPWNQWKIAREAKKRGYNPYLLRVNHKKGPEYTADQAFDQVTDLHKKAGIKDARFRRDKYMGHSSGGNTGLYMATDKRILDTGIKEVHAIAPTPHATALDTIGKKLLGTVIDIDYDRIDRKKGQEMAAKLYKRGKPFVDVYTMAGEADGLVTPKDSVYAHAKGAKVIHHPNSTHFRMSGSDAEQNKIMLDHLVNPDLYEPLQKFIQKYAPKKAA